MHGTKTCWTPRGRKHIEQMMIVSGIMYDKEGLIIESESVYIH
jgi:hypothetical protein